MGKSRKIYTDRDGNTLYRKYNKSAKETIYTAEDRQGRRIHPPSAKRLIRRAGYRA